MITEIGMKGTEEEMGGDISCNQRPSKLSGEFSQKRIVFIPDHMSRAELKTVIFPYYHYSDCYKFLH